MAYSAQSWAQQQNLYFSYISYYIYNIKVHHINMVRQTYICITCESEIPSFCHQALIQSFSTIYSSIWKTRKVSETHKLLLNTTRCLDFLAALPTFTCRKQLRFQVPSHSNGEKSNWQNRTHVQVKNN